MTKEKEITIDTLHLKKIRRKNAKLYPVYKMFSWDLLCFYSIEFLFYTITKQSKHRPQLFMICTRFIFFSSKVFGMGCGETLLQKGFPRL